MVTVSAAQAQNAGWQWGRRLGGTTGNSPSGLYDISARPSADTQGNTYVTGGYDSPATFSGGPATLPHSGELDVVIAKYDSLGRLRWARGGGGRNYDVGTAVATDLLQNVFVVGVTDTGFTFPGSGKSVAGDGGFVAKLDSAGTVLWAKRIGSRNAGLQPSSVATDGFGNAVVLASRVDSLTIGGVHLPRPLNGLFDYVLVSYDLGGNVNWVRLISPLTPVSTNGNVAFDRAAVAADVSGTVYVAGTAGTGTVQASSGVQGTIAATYGLFLVKYAQNGTPQWLRAAPLATAGGVAVNALGRYVYVCGDLETGAQFGSSQLTAANGQDAFVARYSAAGAFQWVRTGGGTNVPNEGRGVAVNAGDEAFLAAAVGGPARFGSASFTWPYGAYRTVVVKYDSTGSVLWATATTIDSAKPVGITLSGSQAPVASFDTYRTVGLGAVPSIVTVGLFDIGLARADFWGRVLTAVPGAGPSASAWGLYPNPATTQVTLDFPPGAGQAEVQVCDLQGRTVWRRPVNAQRPILSVAALPPGLYMVLIRTGDGRPVVTKRLVVE
ncbi:T9SS type A sorting domain-containing protein [Hymenobacter sp. 5317J-9]|uniref:T9SS type A sorting domain-containing protein n=1 Tax=Hymenobacter sp. 5317J-9 TaxID=2932250 RepID=UPI001FD71869|nr:T9SS type A sorting domain-containing protein [Hymenobacter sp. 5317J-9]UOQ95835.1 T9SS type A sorting domain-containing protein [Hymenobacter sp. 5317J-9]